jgi:hypothetical protein
MADSSNVTPIKGAKAGENGSAELSESDKEAIALANATGDSDALGEQGGKSLEDLADDEEGQLQLLDFGDTLSLTIRGKKPTDSSIKIKAISTPIKGQLGDIGDDETILFVGRAQLEKLEMVSKRVDGKVTGKERRHVLDPISFFPFRGKWADRLNALIDEMQAEQEAGGS